jgi:magnesium-transporting ATPase (P-type)
MSVTLDRPPVADSPQQGLTAADAAERLRRDGRNELPQERQRTVFRIVLEAVREPMLQLLLGAGVIYLFVGDLAEALILLAFAVLNVGLVVVQESRTERALAALKDLTGHGNGSPDQTSLPGTSWCSSRATACRLMPVCLRSPICNPTSRC